MISSFFFFFTDMFKSLLLSALWLLMAFHIGLDNTDVWLAFGFLSVFYYDCYVYQFHHKYFDLGWNVSYMHK